MCGQFRKWEVWWWWGSLQLLQLLGVQQLLPLLQLHGVVVQSSQEVAGGRRLEDPARSRNYDDDDCHDDVDDEDCHSDGDKDGVADDDKVALSTSCLMCSACLVLAHAQFGHRTVQS